MTITALTISDISIRQDAQGHYCLNDLHKASGGEQKNRPKYWLLNNQAIDLIEHLKSEESIGGIPPILTKQGFGTFASKELVYAYAMWISPKFHLQVIRAYDSLVLGNTAKPAALSAVDIDQLSSLITDSLAQALPAYQCGLLPEEQQAALNASLDSLGQLFHPLSQPFSDVLGIRRVLKGLDAKLGTPNPNYRQVIARLS